MFPAACLAETLQVAPNSSITQQAIRRGSFSNIKELTRKINASIEQHYAQASPFTWAATAEPILAKAERPCALINGTAH